LQVFDFIEAKFAILIVFEFFLMTTEITARQSLNQRRKRVLTTKSLARHSRNQGDREDAMM